MKIIDKTKTAVWVLNQGEFRVPDYARNCENPNEALIILEPGVPTKIEFTDSLRANSVLVEIEDPNQSDGIVVKEARAEKPKAEKPVETAKPEPGRA